VPIRIIRLLSLSYTERGGHQQSLELIFEGQVHEHYLMRVIYCELIVYDQYPFVYHFKKFGFRIVMFVRQI
jgi:hypothetical protein